jgi:hypothetical protein
MLKFRDDLDAMPGQSGSPLIYTDAANGDMDVVGIVSHEQYFPSPENGALRLTSAMVTQINAWAENSINDPVSAPPSFSEYWYLSRYPDVADFTGTAAMHYALWGQFEGRTAPTADARYDASDYEISNISQMLSVAGNEIEIVGVPQDLSAYEIHLG